MRNKLLFCLFFATAVVLMAAIVVGAFGRADRDGDINGYNLLEERMFEGTVASRGHIIEGLVYFPLTTTSTMVEVQIGPKEFVERSGFKLKTGDKVTVIGMAVAIGEREIVLAREVSGMNGVLIVRDDMGLPVWDRNRPILMDPERRMRTFEICEVSK